MIFYLKIKILAIEILAMKIHILIKNHQIFIRYYCNFIIVISKGIIQGLFYILFILIFEFKTFKAHYNLLENKFLVIIISC